MRISGMGLLIVCGWMTGRMLASGLSDRVKSIETAIRLVDSLFDRLQYLQPPVDRLMEAVGNTRPFESLDYIRNTLAALGDGERFADCWQEALSRTRCGLDREDAAILAAVGQSLGTTDLEGQLQFLTYTRGLLESRLEDARSYSKQHGKLYQSLGLLGGVAIVIVLL